MGRIMDKPIDEKIQENVTEKGALGMQRTGETVPGKATSQQALGFVRRHPLLAVLGTAGAGLIGGLELAVGVVLGAGVAALVGKTGSQAGAPGATTLQAEGVSAREKLARMSPELQRRARAILQAARGRLAPIAT